jgi:hypothetical protein
MSAKVPAAVRLAKEALEEGKCVVIGLQSTGEARTEEAVNKYGVELDDFVSGPRELLLKLVEDHYPLPSEPRHVQAESDVESAESEEESMKCDVCNLEDKSEVLLECSHCGSRQHSACLIPPMFEKPVGDWLCSECGEKTSDYQVERRHYIAEMGRRYGL